MVFMEDKCIYCMNVDYKMAIGGLGNPGGVLCTERKVIFCMWIELCCDKKDMP